MYQGHPMGKRAGREGAKEIIWLVLQKQHNHYLRSEEGAPVIYLV